jgi:restriction system protein
LWNRQGDPDTKASDEFVSTDLPAKAQKDRYASVLHQVALRTLHEIFEADRRRSIETISLTVSTAGIDAATGLPTTTPLLAVATDRASFEPLELSQVLPPATLGHLGALVSKNPHGLVAIDTSKGVRGK